MLKTNYYVISILFLIMFCIGLSCCTDNYASELINIDETIIKKAYIDILRNNAKFIDRNEYIYLHEYLIDCSDDDYTAQVTQFTILDMDGDGNAEVVLQIMPGRFLLLFHYDNDKIYGYHFGMRSMGGLKKDGTFHWSSGAAYHGFSKLKFINGICEINEIGRYENYQNYINGEQVSDDIYYSFQNEQFEKEDVGWHDFFGQTIIDDFDIIWKKLN